MMRRFSILLFTILASLGAVHLAHAETEPEPEHRCAATSMHPAKATGAKLAAMVKPATICAYTLDSTIPVVDACSIASTCSLAPLTPLCVPLII